MSLEVLRKDTTAVLRRDYVSNRIRMEAVLHVLGGKDVYQIVDTSQERRD
jgi:hypothetical protein